MDLKHLTNYQLVLLVLLVSFVTSIATGITTVYLLQQSPTVSSVINQVIQRTASPSAQEVAIVKQTSQAVFIKESDIVPVVVDNIKKSLVTFSYECSIDGDDVAAGETCKPASYGFLVSTKGEFLATKDAAPVVTNAEIYPGGEGYADWKFTRNSESENGFTYNTIGVPTGKTYSVSHFLALAKTLPQEGETLVLYDPVTRTTKKLYVQSVDSSKKKFTVDQPLGAYAGLPVLNLDGNVAGVISMEGGVTSLISGLELSATPFTKVNLTNIQ